MCKKNTSYAQVIYSSKIIDFSILHHITIDISAFYNMVETKKNLNSDLNIFWTIHSRILKWFILFVHSK
jgi:hypothetical protein